MPDAVGLPPGSKQAMQDDLQDLIVGVLRKFPGLHYFQVSSGVMVTAS